MSRPTLQPDPPEAERLIAGWRVISVEPLGKRGLAACANCGAIREVSMIALHELAVSCGCGPPSRSETRARTFAGDAADAESRASRKRHKGGEGGR
jgi:hypothetical protein